MENQIDLSHPKTAREYLRLFLTGFAMGSADIVPGVSGGTMAFILGVYETLIDAIKSFDTTAIQMALKLKIKDVLDHVPWQFLLTLGLGILGAVFTLSRVLSDLLENQPLFIFAFFGGLIVASILAIGIRVKWSAISLFTFIVGTVAAYLIVGLVPIEAEHSIPALFFSGMIAIIAMILPGISGSFILLILGQYEFVLGAVKSFDIVSVGSVGVGAVVGIIGFSRILSWLLKNYEQATIAALVGFMLGSLRKIWQEASTGAEQMDVLGTQEIGLAIGLVIAGFLLVSFLDHLQTKSNPVFRLFWHSDDEQAVPVSVE